MKKLIKPFVIVFVISFLIINWNDISWIFNYNFIASAVYGVYLKDIDKDNDQTSTQQITQKNTPKSNEIKKEEFKYSNKENSIEIPKIKIQAPLILGKSQNQPELGEQLKMGAVIFPNSVLPGQEGETIVLGHSAPLGWPKINYNYIFSELDKLDKGDRIFVYFNNKEYIYEVKEKNIIEKGGEIPQNNLIKNDNMLILVSCWPPGKDYKRIAVRAGLIK